MLAEVWRDAEMLTTGATDYGRVVVSGGDKAGRPTDDSIFGELEYRVRALAIAFRRQVDDFTGGAKHVKVDRNGRRDLTLMRKNLPSYEGRSNVEVAFLERCSEDSVRQERKRRGLDDHGYRAPAAITAPARDTLRQLADRTPTTEVSDVSERDQDALEGGGAQGRDDPQPGGSTPGDAQPPGGARVPLPDPPVA